MRILFLVIGILFDLLIFVLSGALIYCAVDPDGLFVAVDFIEQYLEDPIFRLQFGVVAGVFMIMSLRGIFLLMFGRDDQSFVISRKDNGTLSLSRKTIEHLVSRIAGRQMPAAQVASISISQSRQALRMNLGIRLDISQCNLNEYVERLSGEIEKYFKDSLGIELERLDVQAESVSSKLPIVADKSNASGN
ncbi:MAG TPA: alkaline shock response membrane anchor protein AmaP [bacterium]|nr:alkaline shock response membrane anchor protein AmaP [bacterium]